MERNRRASRWPWAWVLAGAVWMGGSGLSWAQYIGFVYPAGGQQGSKFYVKLGGQSLDAVDRVFVSGEGVSVRVVDFYRSLSNQERAFLSDQLRDLQRGKSSLSSSMADKMLSLDPLPLIGPEEPPGKAAAKTTGKSDAKSKAKSDPDPEKAAAKQRLIDKLQRRMAADNRRPASRSLAELVFVEVSVAKDASPGRREIRVATTRGLSNPMAFYVGQVPEVARIPMKTADQQILGKEYLAKRNRPASEEELRIPVPCTMNGQIASGEINRYRFEARKGQRLIITVLARELIPFIADSVPGWFQPVLTLSDGKGQELAYNDDFRFKPDPTLNFEVPADGEYVLSIHDALYRGREDFVYRITLGELPFITSIYPLGAKAGEPVKVEMQGWNLARATLAPPPADARPGGHLIAAQDGKVASNFVPFELDSLPECQEREGNDEAAQAQEVKLPVIVNGRLERANDWDVFAVEGRAGETLVAEVQARRLDSPVDSFLKITDAKGQVLAFNDDHQDAGLGLNTHHADSYVLLKLPADGKYFVHLGDTARAGGKEYGYRLRLSPPRPGFELRVVTPSIGLRSKSSASVTVYALRQDGYTGPIKLAFRDLPKGFSSSSVILAEGKDSAKLSLRTTLSDTDRPVRVRVTGSAQIDGQEVSRDAVPAEDRMQAFLWRHLLPAQQLVAHVYDSSSKGPQSRTLPSIPKDAKPALKPGEKPKFSEKQVAGLRKQLERLYQEWFLTEDFTARELAKLATVD